MTQSIISGLVAGATFFALQQLHATLAGGWKHRHIAVRLAKRPWHKKRAHAIVDEQWPEADAHRRKVEVQNLLRRGLR